jgi:hypothetical protein
VPGVDTVAALARAPGVNPFELLTVTADTATLTDLRQALGFTAVAIRERGYPGRPGPRSKPPSGASPRSSPARRPYC